MNKILILTALLSFTSQLSAEDKVIKLFNGCLLYTSDAADE